MIRKFRNRPNTINGLQLDSLLERRVYLLLIKKYGQKNIARGQSIRLTPDHRNFKGIFYQPDFTVATGENTSVYIECKGKLISQSQLKLKLLFLAYPQINFLITSDKLQHYPKWVLDHFVLVDDLLTKLQELT
jgi:hypothetical protein